MYMHYLKYVRLNRKDRLKSMRGMTFEVSLLADIIKSHSAISFISPMCDWAHVSLCHSLWMYLSLTLIDQQKVNGSALKS